MESPKTILKVAIVFVLLLVATFWFSKVYYFSQGYTRATVDIRDRLEKGGVVAPMPKEVFALFGIVKSIDEKTNTVSLDAYPPYDPASPSSSQTKVISVTVSSDTQIVKRTTNEADLLSNKTGELTFKDEVINLSALRAGDQVNVESKENILDKTSFTASKIILPE